MSHPVHPCASFPDMSGAPWQSHEQADFSALAAGRLPGSSYAGRDWQSDVEVARLLNPAFIMTASWDSIGVHLFQFLTALVTGGSLSSKLWNNDSPTLLWNSFFGYYWILLCVADAMVKATNKWHEHFFSDDDEEHAANVRSNMHALYALATWHSLYGSHAARRMRRIALCQSQGPLCRCTLYSRWSSVNSPPSFGHGSFQRKDAIS